MTKEEFSEHLDQLFDAERWADARALIVGALRVHRGDHWLLSRLSTTYYEERNYAKALEVAKRAYAAAPNCPLVLWDLAGAMDATGHTRDAIRMYRRLIGRGERAIAHDECGEGERWARALVTDCWYRLGLCYRDTGDVARAIECLEKFLNRLLNGSESIYTDADALRHLKQLGAHSLTIEVRPPAGWNRVRNLPPDTVPAGFGSDYASNLYASGTAPMPVPVDWLAEPAEVGSPSPQCQRLAVVAS